MIEIPTAKDISDEITRQDMVIKELEVKVELWRRSYHESERCLIERGKIIQELEENQRTVMDAINGEIADRLRNRIYELGIIEGGNNHILIDELNKILLGENEI